MATRRNAFGQVKRVTSGNRSVRRAHFVGALRKMMDERSQPESFGKKMAAKLHAALGHVYTKQEDGTWKWVMKGKAPR